LFTIFGIGRKMGKIKYYLMKFAEYNARYIEAPIPISRIIKKYFFKKEYEKLLPKG
jgi:hypothetical protein